jgi:predicted metal-dependent phosphoesterase TrpH
MRADLHAHTTASDGSLSPSALVGLARDVGLDVLAVTDHDSVAGIPEALAAARGTPVRLVPAVELSAVWEGRDVHVLGYFVDFEDRVLLRHLIDLREARLRRAETIVASLTDAGYNIDIQDVLALAAGGSVGRSHVARALVNQGHAATVSDAFTRFLGRGCPFYVPKDVRSPVEVLDVVQSAGGVPVLAHPGVTKVDALITPLVVAGLGGIEAYHAEHTAEQRAHYAWLARSLGLVATGGSDYHGTGTPGVQLGSVDVPQVEVERLLALSQ